MGHSLDLVDDAIAIIGLDCNFPGRAATPQGFWDLLLAGENASTRVPASRFNADAFYHPDSERFGLLNTKNGHFLEQDLGAFDAPFFSISTAEASTMDPQQRGLLESVYRSLENAGLTMKSVEGSKTSCFMGAFMRDYDAVLLAKDANKPGQYKATGNGTAVLANRISWFYDFRGPCAALDTACSSSLVACHLGIQTLRSGEADMSVIGGCNIWILPEVAATLADMGFLSPDGKCYSFDHRANGYSRGEGFGTVIMKRLADAIRDGNTIRAVIRGSAVNQDGRTPGIAMPDSDAQTELIKQAYRSGGIDPAETVFFEAHGTGTQAGDPIEARAIANVFAESHAADRPLYVGAVKSNIGHIEGGAGVAGLIKTVLALEQGFIPPNANFEKPNPAIPADEWNLKFPTAVTPWPGHGPRRASINSFGYGGTNAHVIVEDAKSFLDALGLRGLHRTVKPKLPLSIQGNGVNGGHHACSNGNGASQTNVNGVKASDLDYYFFPVSSADQAGLTRWATALGGYVQAKQHQVTDSSALLRDLCYTLGCNRSKLSYATFTIAASLAELAEALKSPPTHIKYQPNSRLALVFTGQGAQWAQMGRGLMRFSTFSESCQTAFDYLRTLGCDGSVERAWSAAESASQIDKPRFAQPLCTILQIALVDLLERLSVSPAAVIGHSSGEIAAAYAVGAISRKSAWALAFYRGIVSSELEETGSGSALGMMSVSLSPEDAAEVLEDAKDDLPIGNVSLACFNSNDNVTLSGPRAQLEALKQILDARGVVCVLLRVKNAYHSPYMAFAADRYRSLLAGKISPDGTRKSTPALFYSTVEGKLLKSLDELRTSAYWARNLVSPVRFHDAFAAIVAPQTSKLGRTTNQAAPITHFLEVGPHSALRAIVRSNAPADAKVSNYYSVLARREPDAKSLASAVGWLHSVGFQPDLEALMVLERPGLSPPQTLVDLPPYPFDHSQIYWTESRISRSFRFRKHPRLELLGAPVPDWDPAEACWHNYIRHNENPWMKDHIVQGTCIYPAAGMLVMAIEAARQVAAEDKTVSGFRFKDVFFHAVLNIPPASTDGADVHFFLRPLRESATGRSATWSEFRLCSWSTDTWVTNCTGLIATEYETAHTPVDAGREHDEFVRKLRVQAVLHAEKSTLSADQETMYEAWSSIGWEFGPSFTRLGDLRYSDDMHCTASLTVADIAGLTKTGYVQNHLIHPTTLDGVLQCALIGITRGGSDMSNAMVPNSIPSLWVSAGLSAKPAVLDVHGHAERLGFRKWLSWATAMEPSTNLPMVVLEGAVGTEISKGASEGEITAVRSPYYSIDWKPDVSTMSREQIETLVSAGFKLPEEVPKLTEELEKLAFGYVYRCMERLAREPIEFAKPHHEKYIGWMKHQLGRYERGEILLQNDSFMVYAKDDALHAELADRLEATSPDGRAIATVGRELWNILTGETDALELLFSGDVLSVLYRDGLGLQSASSQLGRYLDLMAHKDSALNILELGAGTGGTTGSLLKALSLGPDGKQSIHRFKNYDFTDISIGFFEKGKEKFKDYAERIRFKLLDVEKDPVEQGFTAASYDVVIAANVLHATKSIERTLSNIRRVVKPGGKLILLECTAPTQVGAFVFGTLPGWWLGEEPGRELGPLMDEENWMKALERTGFGNDFDAILRDHPGCSPAYQATSVLISTATSPKQAPALAKSPELPCLSILYDPRIQIQKEVCSAFAQILQQQGTDMTLIERSNFEQVIEDNVEKPCVSILDLGTDLSAEVGPQSFAILKRACRLPMLIWLNEGGGGAPRSPFAESIVGLARAARWENLGMKFSVLTFSEPGPAAGLVAETALQVLARMARDDHPEGQYAYENGALQVPRMLVNSTMNEAFAARNPGRHETEVRPFKDGSGRALRLVVGSPGLLDTLYFEDDEVYDTPLAPGDLEIEVKATGLSFHDVLVGLGRVEDPFMGGECAGYVTKVGSDVKGFKKGDRVVTIFLGSFRTYARGNALLAKKLPDHISFTAAATTPINYCTAWHALVNTARIQKGESVLIHWGAGGLGQAAIQIAQLLGCEVYTTVGSVQKRDALEAAYGIPRDHIFSSRDLSFADGIRRMTGGRGVDVVLNSTAGEYLRASWECIAYYGRFIEVGKYDAMTNSRLPMAPFMRNATFSFLDLCHVNIYHPEIGSDVLDKVITLLGEGKLTEPVPVQLYNYSQIEEAYRFMQSGKHIGKIVFEAHDDDLVKAAKSRKAQYSFKKGATYVLSGGLGGVGRSVAQWLVSRGATDLLFLSRSGTDKPASKELVDQLVAKGINARAMKCDVSSSSELRTVLGEASRTMPPIRGCIQGAMVLEDVTLQNMKYEAFAKVLGPKISGTWNLYQQLPKDMDFYVMLSSISGVFGNPGQANYDMGNTFQDALARHAAAEGRRAYTIDIGVLLGVGYVAENKTYKELLRRTGFDSITEAEFLATMDIICDHRLPAPSVFQSQMVHGIATPEDVRKNGWAEPRWVTEPFFKHLHQIHRSSGGDGDGDDNTPYGVLVAAAASVDEAEAIVVGAIKKKLAKALAVPEHDIDEADSLSKYGIDSLVAVELSTWFKKELQSEVGVIDIMNSKSIQQLVQTIVARSSLVKVDGDEA